MSLPDTLRSKIVSLLGFFRKKTPSGEEPKGVAETLPSEEELLFEAPPEDLSEEHALSENSMPFREEEKKKSSLKRLFRLLFFGLSLGTLLLGGMASWKIFRNVFRDPSGPHLQNLSRKQENLYSPLGFPLTGKRLLQELPEWGISLEEESPGRYRGASKALEIFLVSEDNRMIPLFIGVEEKNTPLKWGLRVGTSEQNLLEFLGEPRERSGDLLIYGDTWGNLLLYRISDERIARVEYHFPRGLFLEE